MSFQRWHGDRGKHGEVIFRFLWLPTRIPLALSLAHDTFGGDIVFQRLVKKLTRQNWNERED